MISIVLGAYTHAFWDTFTHANRMGSDWFPFLDAMLGPLPAFKWLQYGSGVLGLAGLLAWLVWWWRQPLPLRDAVDPVASRTLRRVLIGAVVAATALAAVVAGGGALRQGASPERAAFLAVTQAGAAAMLTLIVVCGVWWMLNYREGKSHE